MFSHPALFSTTLFLNPFFCPLLTPMAPEPEFGNGRRLDIEFGNSPAYFKQLKTKMLEALTHPSEPIRERRKKELGRLEIVYSTVSGALQLRGWNAVDPTCIKRYPIGNRRIVSAGIVGNGIYVGLADIEGREEVAYVCDINTQQLLTEGITIHPFKLSQEYQEEQHLHL